MKRAPKVPKRQREDRRCAVCAKRPRFDGTDLCSVCLSRCAPNTSSSRDGPHMKTRELIQIGPINGWAEYTAKGEGVVVGWSLRLKIDDHAIQGWGATQDEALFMFTETCKQWLKNTNVLPVIA